MSELRRLHLGNSKMYKISRNTFSTLKRLEELFLFGNFITFLPDGAFDDLPMLKVLRLEDNRITTVFSGAFSPQTRLRLQVLDLSGNTFSCDCDLLWLRQWLITDPQLFGNFYKEGYHCSNVKNTSLTEFFLSEQACLLGVPALSVIIAIICLLLVFFFLFTVVFGYRWHIRLWLYEICRTPNAARAQEQDVRGHYKFDVFVAYDEEDLPWVRDELLPKLEEQWALRLCIHQRDFVPGKHIVDNIADCVNESYRILMILSPHFAQSQWCQFELKYCQGIAMDRGEIMVLVALQDPGSYDVTGSMMALLRTTTYILWAEENDARASFWGRLHLALDDVI